MRHRYQQHRQSHHRIVDGRSGVGGRQDAQQQAHRHAQQHLLDAQPGRNRQTVLQQAADGLAGIDKGFTKIAVEHVVHLGQIALHHRAVQAIALIQGGPGLLGQAVGPLGQRVAGNRLQQEKGGRRNDEKGQRHLDKAAYDIFGHKKCPRESIYT